MDPPVWWEWELELSRHVRQRMTRRAFSETDLRVMPSVATDRRPAVTYGRFVIDAAHDGQPWEVVVEPDELSGMLVIVTAYPVT